MDGGSGGWNDLDRSGFDDTAWSPGIYGVGYDDLDEASQLIGTAAPSGAMSIYTRLEFFVDNPAEIQKVLLGADYDDGCVAYINGVEVLRSTEMPAGDPSWNTLALEHESSNGALPQPMGYADVSALAIPLLTPGVNVLAIGVWNNTDYSTDLLIVPSILASGDAGSLAPGESITCTATYAITQEDIDTGFRDNLATATGDDPNDEQVSDMDDHHEPIPQHPLVVLRHDSVHCDPAQRARCRRQARPRLRQGC